MSTPTRDREALKYLIAFSQYVIGFVSDLDENAFYGDQRTVLSVCYCLAVIGEAVGRLSRSIVAANPRIPWHEMRGMRNHPIHRYDRVDFAEVWKTASIDVPVLLKDLVAIHTELLEL